MRFFGHIVRKNGTDKRLMQGKMEGKRRRGRPGTTWFQDLKERTKLDIAGGSQLAKKMAKNHQCHSSADSAT